MNRAWQSCGELWLGNFMPLIESNKSRPRRRFAGASAAGLLASLAGGDIKARKRALGFKANAGKCGTCECFLWLPVGESNRCMLGGFACCSRQGCNAYRHGTPLRILPPSKFNSLD
jgi:hypothetical protein